MGCNCNKSGQPKPAAKTVTPDTIARVNGRAVTTANPIVAAGSGTGALSLWKISDHPQIASQQLHVLKDAFTDADGASPFDEITAGQVFVADLPMEVRSKGAAEFLGHARDWVPQIPFIALPNPDKPESARNKPVQP